MVICSVEEIFKSICTAVVVICSAKEVVKSVCTAVVVVVCYVRWCLSLCAWPPVQPASPWPLAQSTLPWLPDLTQFSAPLRPHGPPSLPLFHLCSTILLNYTFLGASGSRSLGGGGSVTYPVVSVHLPPDVNHSPLRLFHGTQLHVTPDYISHVPLR